MIRIIEEERENKIPKLCRLDFPGGGGAFRLALIHTLLHSPSLYDRNSQVRCKRTRAQGSGERV